MTDVQPLVGAALAGLPAAWHAGSISPDEGALASWMEEQLANSGGLLMFRRSVDPYARAEAYLQAEGVDVARALQRAEDGREAAASRARAAVHAVRGLAIALKKAERQLEFEQEGLQDGCTGFSAAKVRAAAGELTAAEDALLAACSHDRGLARAARRAAG